MTNTTTIADVAATVGDTFKAFRVAAVSSENKATSNARAIFASLINGVSPEMIGALAITAFGDPVRNGKAITDYKALRYFAGGDTVRRNIGDVFAIFANIDADKDGAATIRPLIVAFALKADNAPKNIANLKADVAKAMKAEAKRVSPDNSEAAEETSSEAQADAPKPASLADMIAAVRIAWNGASPEARAEAAAEAAALMDDMTRDANVQTGGDVAVLESLAA